VLRPYKEMCGNACVSAKFNWWAEEHRLKSVQPAAAIAGARGLCDNPMRCLPQTMGTEKRTT
jgi:hypothetical protein